MASSVLVSTLTAKVVQLSTDTGVDVEAFESAMLVSYLRKTSFVDMSLFGGLQCHNSNITHKPSYNYSECASITSNIHKSLLV